MPNRRKATLRDLPRICVFFGAVLGVVAPFPWLGSYLDMENKSDLLSVAGSVERISRTNLGKAGPKMHIFVRDGSRVYHLIEDDLTPEIRGILDLHTNDKIIALVKNDALGRDLARLWELKRNGSTILSYEETRRHVEHRMELDWTILRGVGGLAGGLVIVGCFSGGVSAFGANLAEKGNV